jgi:hypothetical protein
MELSKPPRRVDIIAQAFAARLIRELTLTVEQRAGLWLECVVAEMFPGESVELYGRKIDSGARADRTAKVEAALAAGAAPLEVARKLGVPETTVRRVHKRRRGVIGRQSSP